MFVCAHTISLAGLLVIGLSTLASAGDLIWSQDLNYSYHLAEAYCEIKIHNQDYQNYAGGGHQMADDSDDEDWTAGQQASAGTSTTYSGNGIITSNCYADAAAWCTGHNTGTMTTLWTTDGGGGVDNGTLTDFMDIDDEFSFAFVHAATQHDDRWRLISQSNSTSGTVINGNLLVQGLPSVANPWTGINIEVQIGVDTNNDNAPDSWNTVFYANGYDGALNVGYCFWDYDMYGPFINWYEGEGGFENNTPFEFVASITPGNWVRIIEDCGSSQDIGADDNNDNSGSHSISFTLTWETDN